MPSVRYARALVITSAALLVYWILMAAVAVTRNWPAEFGTTAEDDPTTLWEWIWRGSLVHAPLPPIIAQVLFTLLAFARRRLWVAAAGAGLALLGGLYAIGFLGEPPLRPERSAPPVALYLLVRVVGVVAVLALIGFGVGTAVRALRR